ncbi:MAG TPA: NADH-quinone oxidoreductase subunit C [Kineosporiaceae bacterium]
MTDLPAATARVRALDIGEPLAQVLAERLGVTVTASRDGDATACLDVPADVWAAAALAVRDDVGLDFLDWLSAVDQPDADPPGLDVVLHVVDSRSGGSGNGRLRRLLLRTFVPDAVGRVASLTAVWPGAAWHERETFEMFGLEFAGFDDGSGQPLRPLLLPEGFEGTPLRKSFVLAARVSKPWPGAKEPGESDAHAAPARRKTLPPGVPDPATWPRLPGPDFGVPDAEGDAASPETEGDAVTADGATPHDTKGGRS